MRFQLTILGCNSAIPANGRFPTAQVLNIQEQYYLIDCGEGTQMRMNEHKIRRGRINQIFISHLHGDHLFGIFGLLTSYNLQGRKEKLTVFGPKGLKQIIEQTFLPSETIINYPLEIITIDPTQHQMIFEDDKVAVFSIPLVHRIPTSGFLFREKKGKPNMIAAKIKEHQIPYTEIPKIKAGEDFINTNGERIPNSSLVTAPPKPRAYAYCSDTQYEEAIIPMIKGVDLLYHETTFMHDELERAKKTMHTTAKEAAMIAKAANVGKLITGHYSSRYIDLQPLLAEAKSVFENTVLGIEGEVYEVSFDEK